MYTLTEEEEKEKRSRFVYIKKIYIILFWNLTPFSIYGFLVSETCHIHGSRRKFSTIALLYTLGISV